MWPLLLATSLTIQAPGDLVAAAAASSRPAVCGAAREGTGTLWSRTQRPKTRAFCALLSRAHARIEGDPEGARAAAEKAAALAPGHAAPKVVLGRLAAGEGDAAAALAAFEQARKADPRSLEGPLPLLAYARSLRDVGKLGPALEAYRTLIPRASLLPSRNLRAEALLEAAHVALAAPAGADAARSPDDEALAYLREAARDPFHARRTDVALSLVIALHRAGRIDQADALLREQRGLRAWVQHAEPSYVAAVDRPMLKALALEVGAPDEARTRYQTYLATPGAFEEVARQRLARLAPQRRRGRRGR